MQNPCVQVEWKPDGESSEQIRNPFSHLTILASQQCFFCAVSIQWPLCHSLGHKPAPWEACSCRLPPPLPLQHTHQGSCKPFEVVGIDLGGTWQLAGVRENLQLMFLVSTPAGGAIGESSVHESRILHGFWLILNFTSGAKRYEWMLIIGKNLRLIQTLEPVPSVKLRGSYQATPQFSGSEGQRSSRCGKVTRSPPSLSTGQLWMTVP